MTLPDASLPSTTIDRGIYVMPQFVTFEVSDMTAARHWYVNGLGFVELAVLPGPNGDPVLVHLRRFRYQDILLVPGRDPEDKASGVRVSFAAGDEDLDARAALASGETGGVVEGPNRTPWNTRDLHFRDADGHLVVFTAPDLNADMDSEFARRVSDSVQTAEE
ncbi:MAG: VOC family protein [Chloroflexi bacterium]|nr:VOC family protein [Chloroflexota bacterium]